MRDAVGGTQQSHPAASIPRSTAAGAQAGLNHTTSLLRPPPAAPGVPTTMSTPSFRLRSCAAGFVPPTISSLRTEGAARCLRNREMLVWVCSARSLHA